MNTTYFLNLVAGNLFKSKTNPAIPDELWIGLSTTKPNIDGTGVTEPASNSEYSRVKLGTLSAPSSGTVTNNEEIKFNKSVTNWGTVTHFVIYDAKSGGNLLQYGALDTPRTVEAATIMLIESGSLRLTVQNPS